VLKDKADLVAVFVRKMPFPGDYDVKWISAPFIRLAEVHLVTRQKFAKELFGAVGISG